MKRYIIAGLMLMTVISLSAVQAAAEGEYGWKMLTIPPNTSISAMGGAGAHISGEADAFLSHPTAGLISGSRMISASQNSWHFDTNINTLAINLPQGNRSLGFVLRSLDYGKFDARDNTGEIIGEFHPLDVNLAANAAMRLSPNFYAGLNFGILYQKIDTASSLGAAADLGLTWLPPFRGLSVHAAIKHIGTTSKVKEDKIKLPLTPELSLGYKLPLMEEMVYTELKVLSHPDDDELKMILAANASPLDNLDIRLGYRINYDSHHLSAGIGLKYRKIGFNYAYLPFEYDTNDAHSFGLTYRF